MAMSIGSGKCRPAEAGAVLLGILASATSSLADGAGPALPFVRERLPSGLTVIYHQDRRLPLVAVNLWYHVGSKDEPPGRSGFAHLFEHLMFMGTERVPVGRFDAIIEGAGGSNNASTSNDRTNYFEQGPSSLLSTLLYLEADRMEGFGRGIDQEKLDTQRGVVRQERRQQYENRPYGKAILLRSRLLYPKGHPYHEPVIGSHEDLENATVADVKDFFARFYLPSNASLVVAGDFELDTARRAVEEYFGKIPAGSPPGRPAAPAGEIPRFLTAEKRAAVPDRVQLERVSFSYHSPALFQPGDAELDIASAILAEGKSSRLYRTLVYERKIAQDVAAQQSSGLLGSTFDVQATARPGQDLESLEKALDEELDKLAQTPPSEEEVVRAVNGYEVAFWHRIEPVDGRADLMNSYQFHFGDPDGVSRDLERYRKVTPASVTELLRKTCRKDGRLVLRVVKEGKPAEGLPEEPTRLPAAAPAPPTVAEGSPASKEKPRADLPPRPPEPGPLPTFEPPVPLSGSLAGGIPLWVLPSRQVPLIDLVILVRGAGSAADPPGKEGLAYLAASMLDEGAGSRGAIELSRDLDLLGATLSPAASRERGQIHLSVLKKNLDAALDILADVLLRPRFEAREWERVKALTAGDLVQRRQSPVATARVVADRVFFGPGHPYAAPVAGYTSSVEGLELDEARRFYLQTWRPERAAVVAAGDITLEELKEKLERRLAGWKPGEAASPLSAKAAAAPPPEGGRQPRLVLVEKPQAPQTVIVLAVPGRSRLDPHYADLLLANTIFGGSFTSRLNQNLREKHEFTYGVSSFFHRLRGQGAFVVQTSVKTDVTGEALAEIAREFWGMEGGLREGELEKARSTARLGTVDAFSTVSSTAEVLAAALEMGLPPDEERRLLQRVEALKANQVEKAARDILRWDEAVVVLVGDRRALETEVAEANRLLPTIRAGAKELPSPLLLGPEGEPLPEGK